MSDFSGKNYRRSSNKETTFPQGKNRLGLSSHCLFGAWTLQLTHLYASLVSPDPAMLSLSFILLIPVHLTRA